MSTLSERLEAFADRRKFVCRNPDLRTTAEYEADKKAAIDNYNRSLAAKQPDSIYSSSKYKGD